MRRHLVQTAVETTFSQYLTSLPTPSVGGDRRLGLQSAILVGVPLGTLRSMIARTPGGPLDDSKEAVSIDGRGRKRPLVDEDQL